MLFTITKRVLIGIPTVIGVTIVLFILLHIVPGDPVSVLLQGAPATPQLVASLRHQFGLDQPLPLQYLQFIGGAIHGNLGTSYATRQPVTTMIAQQFTPTIELAFSAALVAAIVGIVLGVTAAARRNSFWDGLIRVISLLGTSLPSFWIGLMLIMIVSFQLKLLPATGSQGISRLILPSIALGAAAGGIVTRLVRNNVLEVLGENFVSALHAKGLSYRTILIKHVLRNAIIPAITIVGFQIGALLAGAVIVETVFARQGLGNVLVQAVGQKDYPVVMGVVLVIAVIYIVINIVVDISYAYIDPRIRSALQSAQ